MLNRWVVAALNHLLARAPWAKQRLLPFSGRIARFESPPFALAVAIDSAGLLREALPEEVAAVSIRLPANLPLLLPQGLDRLIASATVEGNAEFATELSFVLRNLQWDAEEDLSRLFGDIPARRLLMSGRGLLGWQQQAASHLASNVAEYLTLESSFLPWADDYRAWRDGIAALAEGIARLEQQLIHLDS